MDDTSHISLTNQIVEFIVSGIREGTFDAGTRLPSQRELSELYGVSRTVVRDALKILEGRQIIKLAERSGAFVCDVQASRKNNPTTSDISFDVVTQRNIDECIVMVMCESVRLIAKKSSNAEIDSLYRMVHNFSKKYSSRTSVQERFIHETSFHINVVRYSHNAVFQKLIISSLEVLSAWIKEMISDYSAYKKILELDVNIVEALKARDGERAYWLVRERDLLIDTVANTCTIATGTYMVNRDNLLLKND